MSSSHKGLAGSPGKHPFFHTMVAFSSALVGCAGEANSDSTDLPATSGGDASVDATGGTSASGGAESGGSGNSTGGSGSGSTSRPLPASACAPEKWSCSELVYGAVQLDADTDVSGYMIPENCTCEDTRPAQPGDCSEGQEMVCWDLALLDEKTPLDQHYPMSCSCVDAAESCSEQCRTLAAELSMYADGYSCELDAAFNLKLCGAGYVYLR